MKIAIYGQSADKISKNIFLELLSISKSENIILLIEKKYNSILLHKSEISHTHKLFSSYEDLDSTIDLMITIGGDGTLLRSISFVRDLGIPIIGINTGRLGFLATLNQELLNIELKKILKGEFNVVLISIIDVVFFLPTLTSLRAKLKSEKSLLLSMFTSNKLLSSTLNSPFNIFFNAIFNSS